MLSMSNCFNKTANPIHVLFVEDDEYYREIVGDELSENGFIVHSFPDGASLIAALGTAAEADVILLDWSLPEISGIDLLPQLRQRGVELPVVFLTGRALTTIQEHLAFQRGAVDFIDKMRGVEILVRRLRRVVRVCNSVVNPQADKPIVCGKLVLMPNTGRAYWNEVDVGLTIGEYDIVHLLISNVGCQVTYRAIYDRMHYEGFIAGAGDDGYQVNVRSAIKRIRNKFRESDSTFAEIENTTTIGYCWGRRITLAGRSVPMAHSRWPKMDRRYPPLASSA